MLYLLDANVLIDADRDYYPLDGVPQFWEWLTHHGQQGTVKICTEVYDEILKGNGPLTDWLREDIVKAALSLDEESDPEVISNVVAIGYAADLDDIELEEIGRDPFLIAHGMKDVQNRRIVTTEVSAPSKQRQNRRVPDVCTTLGVTCLPAFKFYRELGFRTNWKA